MNVNLLSFKANEKLADLAFDASLDISCSRAEERGHRYAGCAKKLALVLNQYTEGNISPSLEAEALTTVYGIKYEPEALRVRTRYFAKDLNDYKSLSPKEQDQLEKLCLKLNQVIMGKITRAKTQIIREKILKKRVTISDS
ncbi:hypothetical protein HYT24_02460 [Candidatus Pacearchaeota archaeon]|nr:hypothetical protein [Candidatus Pacearchaeota archaeon]